MCSWVLSESKSISLGLMPSSSWIMTAKNMQGGFGRTLEWERGVAEAWNPSSPTTGGSRGRKESMECTARFLLFTKTEFCCTSALMLSRVLKFTRLSLFAIDQRFSNTQILCLTNHCQGTGLSPR